MMANKENLPPAFPPSHILGLSPSNKPALSRQRDHSACRRQDTPLKVKKTRENLKQHTTYAGIPPPCQHAPHQYSECSLVTSHSAALIGPESKVDNGQEIAPGDGDIRGLHPLNLGACARPSAPPPEQSVPAVCTIQHQRSISRRMLSKVKQGIANRAKPSQAIRQGDSEASSLRTISSHRKRSDETRERVRSLEICRDSIDSCFDKSHESFETGPSTENSLTNSTVSTAEVFGDRSMSGLCRTASAHLGKPAVLDLLRESDPSLPLPSSPTPQPTPRPLRWNLLPVQQRGPLVPTIKVPCVELEVISDCATLDVHAKRDVWIAMKATVRVKTTKFETNIDTGLMVSTHPKDVDVNGEDGLTYSLDEQAYGVITTLRLCFKPMNGCRIREIVGRKTMKDVTLGHTCSLFIRLHIPRVQATNNDIEPDQNSLFTELESIMGILETDILHAEARYRHSLLPPDNVVAVRHICKIKRPETASRWSIIDYAGNASVSSEAQKRLARHIASEYPAEQALELIQEYLDSMTKDEAEICEIRKSLTDKFHREQDLGTDDTRPSVVVTDIDWDPITSTSLIADHFSTAPSTPVLEWPVEAGPVLPGVDHNRKASARSLPMPTNLAPPLISAPKTTTALSTAVSPSSDSLKAQADPASGPQDTARQLWRHIRRASLSTKQLEAMTPERLEHLAASDDSLKELRRRALANKRSVGAETLKGWKWEEDARVRDFSGEAPWM